MNKRLISGLLSAVMAINVITILPANAFALGTESKVYEKDGYTVTYQIGSEWDGNRSVEVSIKNTGEESILNWALKYDVGGEVYNLWNSKVYDSSEEYTIIKNNGYNYEIEPGQSANYGYIVKGEETVIPEDIELCSRRIDVKSGYEIDFNVTSDWYTGFNGEISITNVSDEPIEAWTLSFDSNFDINNIWNAKLLTSENRSYEAANQLWTTPIKAGESASFGFSAEKSATENANAENFVLTAVVVGRSALEYPDFDDIDYELDSDSDGLPDYYEDILGTDKNNPDTDGDGLTDGYEVFYLGTDPLKADSDDNGVNDGDEDPDNDGLSNLKECELGTDPNNSDTDGDGLTDGAEVNIHKTDPLKYDTDEDGISDGDEIALGLDPNSGSTNGTPDSERTFTQTVSADSEALSAINEDEEMPFKVSLEMKAAGVAENNVYARESGYSNAIENSAILGAAPEFVYTDGLAVEEVTVKFELNNSAINNTLGTYAAENDGYKGIKRLNVFMFFEDVNMLLPIETQYDEAKNIVSATTDRVGTYCLMDMELFFHNLGIEPSKSADVEDSEAMSGNAVYNDGYLCYTVKGSETMSSKSKYKDNFDVAFIIDQVNYYDDVLGIYYDKIIDTADAIWNISPNVNITVYGLNGNGVTFYNNYGRYNTHSEMRKALLKATKHIDSIEGVGTNLSAAVDDVAAKYSNKKVYCFAFFDSTKNNYQTSNPNGKTTLYGIKHGNLNIDISVISNIPDEKKGIADESHKPYAAALFEMTNGVEMTRDNFVNEALIHIYGEIPNASTIYSMGVFATNWRKVELEAPITVKYKENSEKDFDQLDMSDLEGCADTDRDGLYDFQEILFYLYGDTMSFDEDGNVHLYSLNELSEKNSIFKKFPTYVEAFVDKIKKECYDEYIEFLDTPIVLLKSDPTKKDGDYDGLVDKDDPAKLNNEFTGIFVDSDYGIKNANVTFKVDFNLFFKDQTKYNRDLSTIASLLSHDVYDKRYVKVNDVTLKASTQDSPLNMALLFGLQDVQDIVIYNPDAKYSEKSETGDNIMVYDDDITEFIIGHYKVEKGHETREIVAIIVRGTNGTIEEWTSNFDVGADTDDYYDATGQHFMWKNKENHKGFDVTANRVLNEIEKYMNEGFVDKSSDVSFFVTGHSRGAAIANLIAKDLIDKSQYSNDKVFGYTFAAPNNTISVDHANKKYDSIFNIVNSDDLIPHLPLGETYGSSFSEYDSWGFTKYGVIKPYSIKDNCEAKWQSISGIWDYNSNGNFNNTLNAFGKIIDTSSGLPRNALYAFTDSDDECISFNILNYIDDKTSIDEFEKKYGKRMAQFCRIRIVDKSTNIYDQTEHKAIIQQSPAFLMMDLVYITVPKNRGGKIHGTFGYDVAEKYENAKWEFIHSGIDSILHGQFAVGGMTHPHLPMSYYLISTELS